MERSGIEALQQSKDLWVTAWLIEGMTRLYGFAGLRDGVLLAHGLCERFWDPLHPSAGADGDLVTRFAQLAGLDGGSNSEGTLLTPILNVPLTGGPTARPFSWADHQDALDLERKGPDLRQRRVAQGAATLDLFNQAIADSGAAFVHNVIADLEATSKALVDFSAFLRGKELEVLAAGGKPFVPPSSKIRDALDGCLRLCRACAQDAFPQGDPTVATQPPWACAPMARAGQFGGLGIESRQEAFATLLRVSEYFRRAEPHSPVSYALEQAVRWGRMSLPELLSDLVSDRSTREDIFRRAGIVGGPGAIMIVRVPPRRTLRRPVR